MTETTTYIPLAPLYRLVQGEEVRESNLAEVDLEVAQHRLAHLGIEVRSWLRHEQVSAGHFPFTARVDPGVLAGLPSCADSPDLYAMAGGHGWARLEDGRLVLLAPAPREAVGVTQATEAEPVRGDRAAGWRTRLNAIDPTAFDFWSPRVQGHLCQFFDRCCVFEHTAQVDQNELLNAYQHWAQQEGGPRLSSGQVCQVLAAISICAWSSFGGEGTFFRGVRLGAQIIGSACESDIDDLRAAEAHLTSMGLHVRSWERGGTAEGAPGAVLTFRAEVTQSSWDGLDDPEFHDVDKGEHSGWAQLPNGLYVPIRVAAASQEDSIMEWPLAIVFDRDNRPNRDMYREEYDELVRVQSELRTMGIEVLAWHPHYRCHDENETLLTVRFKAEIGLEAFRRMIAAPPSGTEATSSTGAWLLLGDRRRVLVTGIAERRPGPTLVGLDPAILDCFAQSDRVALLRAQGRLQRSGIHVLGWYPEPTFFSEAQHRDQPCLPLRAVLSDKDFEHLSSNHLTDFVGCPVMISDRRRLAWIVMDGRTLQFEKPGSARALGAVPAEERLADRDQRRAAVAVYLQKHGIEIHSWITRRSDGRDVAVVGPADWRLVTSLGSQVRLSTDPPHEGEPDLAEVKAFLGDEVLVRPLGAVVGHLLKPNHMQYVGSARDRIGVVAPSKYPIGHEMQLPHPGHPGLEITVVAHPEPVTLQPEPPTSPSSYDDLKRTVERPPSDVPVDEEDEEAEARRLDELGFGFQAWGYVKGAKTGQRRRVAHISPSAWQAIVDGRAGSLVHRGVGWQDSLARVSLGVRHQVLVCPTLPCPDGPSAIRLLEETMGRSVQVSWRPLFTHELESLPSGMMGSPVGEISPQDWEKLGEDYPFGWANGLAIVARAGHHVCLAPAPEADRPNPKGDGDPSISPDPVFSTTLEEAAQKTYGEMIARLGLEIEGWEPIADPESNLELAVARLSRSCWDKVRWSAPFAGDAIEWPYLALDHLALIHDPTGGPPPLIVSAPIADDDKPASRPGDEEADARAFDAGLRGALTDLQHSADIFALQGNWQVAEGIRNAVHHVEQAFARIPQADSPMTVLIGALIDLGIVANAAVQPDDVARAQGIRKAMARIRWVLPFPLLVPAGVPAEPSARGLTPETAAHLLHLLGPHDEYPTAADRSAIEELRRVAAEKLMRHVQLGSREPTREEAYAALEGQGLAVLRWDAEREAFHVRPPAGHHLRLLDGRTTGIGVRGSDPEVFAGQVRALIHAVPPVAPAVLEVVTRRNWDESATELDQALCRGVEELQSCGVPFLEWMADAGAVARVAATRAALDALFGTSEDVDYPEASSWVLPSGTRMLLVPAPEAGREDPPAGTDSTTSQSAPPPRGSKASGPEAWAWHIFDRPARDRPRFVPDIGRWLVRQGRFGQWTHLHGRDRSFFRQMLASMGVEHLRNDQVDQAVARYKEFEGVVVDLESVDAEDHVLHTPAGPIDLPTGHYCGPRRDPDVVFAHTTAVPPLWEQGGPTAWLDFLRTVVGDELIPYVQRALGYSLTGKTSEQVMFMCLGPAASGKSTFLRVLETVAGAYATRRLNRGSDVDPSLVGKRIALMDGGDAVLPEAHLKHLVDGAPLSARHLYGEFFSFTPRVKLWAANQRLTIPVADAAIGRRIRVIPFRAVPSSVRRTDILDRLIAEGPQILAWCLEGATRWYGGGSLDPTPAMAAAAEALRNAPAGPVTASMRGNAVGSALASAGALLEFVEEAVEVDTEASDIVDAEHASILRRARSQAYQAVVELEDLRLHHAREAMKALDQIPEALGRASYLARRLRAALVPYLHLLEQRALLEGFLEQPRAWKVTDGNLGLEVATPDPDEDDDEDADDDGDGDDTQ